MNTISTYIFRPKRILFYMNTTQSDIENFYNGIIPGGLLKYEGAFGSYDHPGLFTINKDWTKLKVLGIEFRPDDDRIEYPLGLEQIVLEQSFVKSDILIDDNLDDKTVTDYVSSECAKGEPYYPFLCAKGVLKKNPEVVELFMMNGQNRILIDADYTPGPVPTDIPEDATPRYKELYDKTYRDSITGYYNWNYLWLIMTSYGLYGIQDYAFVYFDVKDFKAINIVYGHDVANNFLKKITKQMEKQDWIYYSAKSDNDNFAMMVKDMDVDETRKKLEKFFSEISCLDEDPIYKVYFRCGVVPMRSTMMLGNRVADAAKQARAFGTKPFKTEIIYYSDEMREAQERSIRIMSYLDTAIECDEFLVYYQPKYDINTGNLHGAEALIRWKYKGKDLFNPGQFVPIFESGGLIGKVDDIVLKKVCHQFKEWEKEGKELLPVSVNVSRKSVVSPGLVDHLTEIVDSFGVDHSLIDFELTESAAFYNQSVMISVINGLKKKGFKISMDDFGTGYSSLSLLPLMPFDTLKIDKSFVDGIGRNESCQKNCALVKHIIALAKDMKLTCLAEGAETKEQVDLLRDFGCEIVQGFFYSKPVPVDKYEMLLSSK